MGLRTAFSGPAFSPMGDQGACHLDVGTAIHPALAVHFLVRFRILSPGDRYTVAKKPM